MDGGPQPEPGDAARPRCTETERRALRLIADQLAGGSPAPGTGEPHASRGRESFAADFLRELAQAEDDPELARAAAADAQRAVVGLLREQLAEESRRRLQAEARCEGLERGGRIEAEVD
ncbi:unnamed protein product, partial [Prorocentrum cordatum]